MEDRVITKNLPLYAIDLAINNDTCCDATLITNHINQALSVTYVYNPTFIWVNVTMYIEPA